MTKICTKYFTKINIDKDYSISEIFHLLAPTMRGVSPDLPICVIEDRMTTHECRLALSIISAALFLNEQKLSDLIRQHANEWFLYGVMFAKAYPERVDCPLKEDE